MGLPISALFPVPFPGWIPSAKPYWVSFGKRRSQRFNTCQPVLLDTAGRQKKTLRHYRYCQKRFVRKSRLRRLAAVVQ